MGVLLKLWRGLKESSKLRILICIVGQHVHVQVTYALPKLINSSIENRVRTHQIKLPFLIIIKIDK